MRSLERDPLLRERVERLMTIPAVGPITALTWALEVGEVQTLFLDQEGHQLLRTVRRREEIRRTRRNARRSRSSATNICRRC